MNIQNISLEQYKQMSLKEKENFINVLSLEQSSYCTYTIATRQRITKNIKTCGDRQKNGRLTFIEELKRTDKKVSNFSYLCKCDCGKWFITTNRHFDIEDTISCGCYKKEYNVKVAEQLGYKNCKDITGQIFGDLKVISKTNKRIHDSVVWNCKCIKCGKDQEVQSAMLIANKRVFCEYCNKEKSKRENIITALLESSKINFQKEYSFQNCRFSDTNKLARFDFYVDNKYLIEFDGIQHFIPQKFSTEISQKEAIKNFIKLKEHDSYKNQWCKENGIPLIRIPYTHLNKICLEDLLLSTSKFLQ